MNSIKNAIRLLAMLFIVSLITPINSIGQQVAPGKYYIQAKHSDKYVGKLMKNAVQKNSMGDGEVFQVEVKSDLKDPNSFRLKQVKTDKWLTTVNGNEAQLDKFYQGDNYQS